MELERREEKTKRAEAGGRGWYGTEIDTQMQTELLNNSYVDHNNQLITPRKVGIAGNYCTPTRPHTRQPPLSSSTEKVYHRLTYTGQLGRSTQTASQKRHEAGQHEWVYRAMNLHKHTNLSSQPSSWPVHLLVLRFPSQPHLSCLDQSLGPGITPCSPTHSCPWRRVSLCAH